LQLAREPALLASIGKKLQEGRLNSALFDTAMSTRHIESAYTMMWERHKKGQPPEGFKVQP
jgi:protein O-GlcNAc transferase